MRSVRKCERSIAAGRLQASRQFLAGNAVDIAGPALTPTDKLHQFAEFSPSNSPLWGKIACARPSVEGWSCAQLRVRGGSHENMDICSGARRRRVGCVGTGIWLK